MDLLTIISGLNQGLSFFDKIKNIGKAFKIIREKEKVDYIVLDAKKQVTVLGNGHGIIICSFEIYVVNPEKFKFFYRKTNIEDAAINSNFPSLAEMQKCNINERFEKFGFWFECDNNCIEEVEEFYWKDDDFEGEDQNSKANPRELKYRFKMNTNNMERGKTYKLVYSISIPGMYPLKDYKFDKSLLAKNAQSQSKSAMRITHYVRKLTYTVSFEKEILFTAPPCGEIFCPTRDMSNGDKNHKPLESRNISDIFYKRYQYITKNPSFHSKIIIKWQFK